jgi:hypothetical protein
MSVILGSSEPANVERHPRESHSDHDRSERWRDYSVDFGNEVGPIASLPQGTGHEGIGHGFGPSLVYGRTGWSLHGLSRG